MSNYGVVRSGNGPPQVPGYKVVGVLAPVVPLPIIVTPGFHVEDRSREKVKVAKSRPELFKDAREVIASNRQKYEDKILDFESKLDGLMAVFDPTKNDAKAQSHKRQVISLVDTAREHRQHWVDKLDTTWEQYEALYHPLTEQELDMFEAAISRAEAPMDVQDRGISLLGGEHVSMQQQPQFKRAPSTRMLEPSSAATRRAPSTRMIEPSYAATGTQRSIATGYSQRPEFSTAVTSNFSMRSGATSRATSARPHSITHRPTGARVAETGELSRKTSRGGSTLAPIPEASTRVSSRHSTVRGSEMPETQVPRSTVRGTTRVAPSARTDLLRQATRASSLHASSAGETGRSGNLHVSAARSSRR